MVFWRNQFHSPGGRGESSVLAQTSALARRGIVQKCHGRGSGHQSPTFCAGYPAETPAVAYPRHRPFGSRCCHHQLPGPDTARAQDTTRPRRCPPLTQAGLIPPGLLPSILCLPVSKSLTHSAGPPGPTVCPFSSACGCRCLVRILANASRLPLKTAPGNALWCVMSNPSALRHPWGNCAPLWRSHLSGFFQCPCLGP